MVSSVTDEARVVSAGKQCVRMVRPQQPGAVFNQLGQQMRGPGRITAATQETGVSTFALCCELGDDRGRRRCGVIVT